jgi:hypothetical protein
MHVANTTKRAKIKKRTKELVQNRKESCEMLEPFMEEIKYLAALKASDMKLFGKVSDTTEKKLAKLKEKIMEAKATAAAKAKEEKGAN